MRIMGELRIAMRLWKSFRGSLQSQFTVAVISLSFQSQCRVQCSEPARLNTVWTGSKFRVPVSWIIGNRQQAVGKISSNFRFRYLCLVDNGTRIRCFIRSCVWTSCVSKSNDYQSHTTSKTNASGFCEFRLNTHLLLLCCRASKTGKSDS